MNPTGDITNHWTSGQNTDAVSFAKLRGVLPHVISAVSPLSLKPAGAIGRLVFNSEIAMRKRAFTFAIFLCALAIVVSAQSFRDSQKSEENTKWISDSLREMKTIEVGKARADLLKVFTTEGGLSTGLRRTYVYRKCPYTKVDVEFEAVGRPARDAEGRETHEKSDKDTIKSISKPYLEWSVAD